MQRLRRAGDSTGCSRAADVEKLASRAFQCTGLLLQESLSPRISALMEIARTAGAPSNL